MNLIKAPFTDEQVAALNRFQQSPHWHPFTCGGRKCRENLVATNAGWVCPKCDYTQDWAHAWMATDPKSAWEQAREARKAEGVA